MHTAHRFPGVFMPCGTCRGGIYKNDPTYLWWQDHHFVRVCADCDYDLMRIEWHERQATIESVINSLSLDRRVFALT